MKQNQTLSTKKVNKALQIHAGWLWGHGYIKEAMECFDQAKPENDKRDLISYKLRKKT
jgi:hypothetical protein